MAGSADLVIRVLADTSGATGEISKLQGTLGKALGLGAIGGAVAVTTQAATDWQAAMARIASAYNDVSFTAGSAKFDAVQTFIRNLSTQSATSAGDLADIFGVAARFAPDSLQKAEELTTTVAELGKVSSDLGGDLPGTAQQLAAFLKLFEDTNAAGVGSAIAKLGTMHVKGESPVLQMAQDMAQAGHQFGLSEAQVLGLSNTLVEANVTGSRGATSMTRMLLELGQAAAAAGDGVDENSKKIRNGSQRVGDLQSQLAIAEQRRSEMFGRHGLKTQFRRHPSEVMAADENIRRIQEELGNARSDLAEATNPVPDKFPGQRLNINEAAKVAGESTADFVSQFQSDPFGAFTGILTGLRGMNTSEQEASLGKMGFKQQRDVQNIEALVSKLDMLGTNVGAAQSELDNPTTLPQRNSIVQGTTAAKVSDALNTANIGAAVAGEPGRQGLDAVLTSMLTDVREQGFVPFEEKVEKATTAVDGFANALKPVTDVLGNVPAPLLVAGGAAAGKGAAAVAGALGAGAVALPVAILAALGITAASIKLGVDHPELVNQVALNQGTYANSGQQGVQVNVGDIHTTGPTLEDVLDAVKAQITAAWNAAHGSQPVTGQVGGNYTSGQGPR